MPATPKAKFSENEKLLCYHGPLLYEAKCVKYKKEGGQYMYFVHYQGWNKNWGEWVAESRVLKINSENTEKQEKLLAAHIAATREKRKSKKISLGGALTPSSSKKSSGGGTPGGGGSDSANTSRASTPVSERSAATSSKKRAVVEDDQRSTSSREDDSISKSSKKTKKHLVDSTSQEEDEDSNEEGLPEDKPFKIRIPEELKYVLGSDWDLIVHSRKLVSLPARTTVANILADFMKSVEKSEKDLNRVTQVNEIVQGIKDFFNHTVGSELLYKFEQLQYQQTFKPDSATDGVSPVSPLPSDIYGSAHLLRLMLKINGMLGGVITSGDTTVIEVAISDFLDFLDSNRAKYFTSKNYAEAPEEYLKQTTTE